MIVREIEYFFPLVRCGINTDPVPAQTSYDFEKKQVEDKANTRNCMNWEND